MSAGRGDSGRDGPGDFLKSDLEKVSRGTQPACCGQVARSEGLLTLQAWTFSPGSGSGAAREGRVRWAATPTELLVTDSVKTLQEK